jgi:hypothetical protein
VRIRRTQREGCQQGMRSAHAARSAAAAASAAAGWVASRVHLGDGGAPRAETRVRGERCTAHRPSVYRNEKGYTTVFLSRRIHGVTAIQPARHKGTGVTGRSRAAGRRRAGRSVPTGKEHRSSRVTRSFRTSFHYGKNGYVLSGIGTDRPARRRPAALDRPGTGGRVRGGLRRERAMTLMTSQSC